jgi:uncharacterized damage-inducible protein DinB
VSVERPLDHALRHNTWATGALIEFLHGLDPVKHASATPGTYGSIEGTLHHLVRGQQWYLQLLTGEVIGKAIPRGGPKPTLDDLAAVSKATGHRAADVAATDDPARRIEMNEGRRSTVGVILAQLIHHGNEHRTQITTILGANGIAPPPLSAWAYGRAAKISEAEE